MRRRTGRRDRMPPKEERFFRFPRAGSSAKFPEERKLREREERGGHSGGERNRRGRPARKRKHHPPRSRVALACSPKPEKAGEAGRASAPASRRELFTARSAQIRSLL